MASGLHGENSSVQLELCPGGAENLRLYEATLCRLCNQRPRLSPDPRPLAVEEGVEDQGLKDMISNMNIKKDSNATSANSLEKLM